MNKGLIANALLVIIFGLGQTSLSQTLDDIKMKVSTGEMSVEEAIRQSKLKGVPSAAIDTAAPASMKRVKSYSPVYLRDYINLSRRNLSDLQKIPSDSLKEALLLDTVAAKERLPYFGYDIFRRIPENFRQIQVGPVDPNYVIGPGDEIILSMWGDTEQRYSLPVERDGTIYLEKAGQVVVNGYTVDELKKRLETILSKYYSTIKPARGRPSTFIDVSLGKLRPILIYVIGEVNQPGAYTQDAYSTVFGALLISGGPTYSGSLRDVQIIRNNQVVANFDLYQFLMTGKKEGDIRLRNDDIIFVPHRLTTIYLKGEVNSPGVFELMKDESLRDLIHYARGLATTADINRVEIERFLPFNQRNKVTQENRIIIDAELGQYTDGDFIINDIVLKDLDFVTVFPVYDQLKNFIAIDGAVHQPGRYEFKPGITVDSLIEAAQGLLPVAYRKQIQIKRTYPDLSSELLALDISNERGLKTELIEWDSVRIFSVWELQDQDSVRINGEVRMPGKYPLYDKTNLKDIILQAGGFTKVAYRHNIEVFRADPKQASLEKLASVYNVEIKGDIFESQLDDDDFQLFDNDQIVVRSIPYFKYQQNVVITGEVKFPGTYTLIRNDETLSELVKRAGGLTPHAFLDGIVFTRGKQNLVADFQNVFSGRKGQDIIIEANDRIFIPRHPQTVEVIGMVNNPGLQKYMKGLRVREYIEQAGGFHRDADKGEVYVYQANGTAKRDRKIGSPKVTEGSKIIVGRKEEREPLDITEFLKEVASITASVVTIIILVTRVK